MCDDKKLCYLKLENCSHKNLRLIYLFIWFYVVYLVESFLFFFCTQKRTIVSSVVCCRRSRCHNPQNKSFSTIFFLSHLENCYSLRFFQHMLFFVVVVVVIVIVRTRSQCKRRLNISQKRQLLIQYLHIASLLQNSISTSESQHPTPNIRFWLMERTLKQSEQSNHALNWMNYLTWLQSFFWHSIWI